MGTDGAALGGSVSGFGERHVEAEGRVQVAGGSGSHFAAARAGRGACLHIGDEAARALQGPWFKHLSARRAGRGKQFGLGLLLQF